METPLNKALDCDPTINCDIESMNLYYSSHLGLAYTENYFSFYCKNLEQNNACLFNLILIILYLINIQQPATYQRSC